jgi:hypothetical protein
MRRDVRSLIQSIVAVSFTMAVAVPVVAQAPTPQSGAVTRDYAAELACGAHAVAGPADMSLRVAGGREAGKSMFGPGDPLIIRGGSPERLKVGQEYFVRRVISDRFVTAGKDGMTTSSIHTAGWVKIADVQDDTAIATITKVCDSIEAGDYLEPFVKPAVPTTSTAAGEPDFSDPGHLVLGDERRQMAAKGDMMVLDRGSDHGLRPGQRLTVYRTTAQGSGPVTRIAEATAMVVHPETTIIRIDKTSDAVLVGDLVAIHR